MSHRRLLAVAPLLAALGACSSAPQPDIRPVFSVDGTRLETGLPPFESGKRHLAAGRPALAAESFRLAVAAERNPRTLNGLAAAWDQLGRFDLADALYGEALAMAPGDPQTLNNMGWSQLVRGEAGRARGTLALAARAAPGDTVVEANLRRAETASDAMPARPAEPPPPAAAPRPAVYVERSGTAIVTLVTTGHAPFEASGTPRKVATAFAPASAPSAPPAPPARAVCGLELSNGAGRRHMAARMRSWLDGQVMEKGCLTNAERFDFAHTIIFFREGFAEEARRLASLLPVPAETVRDDSQRNGVRLRLGRDLLGFDDGLLDGGSA